LKVRDSILRHGGACDCEISQVGEPFDVLQSRVCDPPSRLARLVRSGHQEGRVVPPLFGDEVTGARQDHSGEVGSHNL
jgi:hypothetical protein